MLGLMTDIRDFLAAETNALHRLVDARASAFDLATEDGFHEFLAFMWQGCAAAEAALTRAGAAEIFEEWPRRVRAVHLDADLGGRMAKPAAKVPIDGEAEVWGALYVLEGSRLGARMIARTTPLADRSAFFRITTKCRFWPEFLDRLRAADQRLADRKGMAYGARKGFAAFLETGDAA